MIKNPKYYVLIPFIVIFALLFAMFLIIYNLMKLNFTKKPFDTIRECDPMGCGYFGASRDGGKRKHKGVDLLAKAGEYVFAPFECEITKIGQVYKDTPVFKYVEFKGKDLLSVYRFRIFYTTQDYDLGVKVGQELIKGAPIGFVQNIAAHYGQGMQNHVHVEARCMGILVDPTPFLKLT